MDRVLTALPVFNEVRHVRAVISEVRRFCDDVLVVDDGSTDGTPEVLAGMGVRVVRHPDNRGYGAALRTAFETALQEDYDGLVTIDCDGQHQPASIHELVAALDAEPRADIVSGSRYLVEQSAGPPPPADRRRINQDITRLLNRRLGLQLTDAFCGFKAYSRRALSVFDVSEDGYGMPLQIWVQAVHNDLRVVELAVPLLYLEEERSFGGSLDDARQRMSYYLNVIEREMARCGDVADVTT